MSDEEVSPLEALKLRHTKEKKELQAKVTSLKHSVTKNDKKKKKEVQTEVDSLEKELKERHEKELHDLESKLGATKITDEVKEEPNKDEENGEEDVVEEDKPKKLTKTQKQREKKLEAERKRALAVKLDQENSSTSRGTLETQRIKEILMENKLRLVDIPSDGDCLFNAIAHQLNLNDSQSNFTGELVRQKCAEYMRKNSDEFLPFLDEEHANEDGFKDYCLKVERSCRNGGDWGSATELKAASFALERPIKVIYSDGTPHEFGEDFKTNPLIITFHRHLLALGEHYNATENAV